MTVYITVYIDLAVWEFSNVGIRQYGAVDSMSDLAVLFGQLCIVQLSGKVD